VEIPMRGRIESLNVASAAAVILYELCRQGLDADA
jgi:tRNA G18 (ribose-2'-O)-methylase SpoU